MILCSSLSLRSVTLVDSLDEIHSKDKSKIEFS